MNVRGLAGLLLAMLALFAAPMAIAAPARPAAKSVDWSRTVTMSPDGSFVMGNPKARLLVTEFASYTCPHCAHFNAETVPPMIAGYVRPGLVRYEFRNAVHDGFDLSAAVLARCAGPAGFFALTDAFYAAQPQWEDRANKWADAQASAIETAPAADKPMLFAQGAGLSAIAAAHGVPLARQKACLADQRQTDAILGMVRDAQARDIPGTPAIFVAGKLVAVRNWAELEPIIKQAL